MTTEAIEEFRRAGYETSEAIAPGWERRRAFIEEVSTPVRSWMLRELAPQPDQTLLELAAGAGDTGFEAAAAVGEGGHVISTDFSPAMVEVARRRGTELGVDNVEYRVMDAERIELDSDSVDGVLCQSAYMLMADPAAALAETRRVLRAGGRLALSVWGAPERNPWASIGGRFLVERGHLPPPEPGTPGIFAMASDERTRALLDGAGFAAVRTAEVPVRWAFSDLDAYERWVVEIAGASALVVRALPEAERKVLRSQLEEAFRPFAADGGYELPGLALCAAAS
jgi:SAM-dependent methyltransferase